MPVNILNLPSYVVLTAKEAEYDYHIKVETANPKAACDACKTSPMVGYGRIELLVNDLPMHGKRVGINFDARRFMCKTCGKTFMETLPG